MVNIAQFPEFGDPSAYDAAEIVDETGQVFAVVREPYDRLNRAPAWTVAREAEFLDTLQAWAHEEVSPASAYTGVYPVYLTIDPARDTAVSILIFGD